MPSRRVRTAGVASTWSLRREEPGILMTAKATCPTQQREGQHALNMTQHGRGLGHASAGRVRRLFDAVMVDRALRYHRVGGNTYDAIVAPGGRGVGTMRPTEAAEHLQAA